LNTTALMHEGICRTRREAPQVCGWKTQLPDMMLRLQYDVSNGHRAWALPHCITYLILAQQSAK
jgi:hypothetical protein